QSERSFQKQPTIFLNRKKGLGAKKRKSLRYIRNVGLGFKTPRETERAFQKQPHLNLNRKFGQKKKALRRYRNVGLGFKTPRELASCDQYPNKMADSDMSFCQRAVIEFLVKEEIPAAEIHQRLQRAYGSVCMGASSVRRWVKHFKVGNTSIKDKPWSSSPRTASTECNKERVDEIIQDDRHVTVDTIAQILGIGNSAVQEMIES
ncbi:hypothetical protein B7P43_G07488, partial [Cryptotermes secundus]